MSDIKSSCDFYGEKLGFAVAFAYGEPPFYAQVRRDGVRINLRSVDRPPIDADLRDREQLLSAALTVETTEEIKQLYLEFQAAGVTFSQGLKREPWGARNFIVRDIDGNLLPGERLTRDRYRALQAEARQRGFHRICGNPVEKSPLHGCYGAFHRFAPPWGGSA